MTRRTKIEEPQQRGRRKQTDDDCADDAAGDDDHADVDAPSNAPLLHSRLYSTRDGLISSPYQCWMLPLHQ